MKLKKRKKEKKKKRKKGVMKKGVRNLFSTGRLTAIIWNFPAENSQIL